MKDVRLDGDPTVVKECSSFFFLVKHMYEEYKQFCTD